VQAQYEENKGGGGKDPDLGKRGKRQMSDIHERKKNKHPLKERNGKPSYANKNLLLGVAVDFDNVDLGGFTPGFVSFRRSK